MEIEHVNKNNLKLYFQLFIISFFMLVVLFNLFCSFRKQKFGLQIYWQDNHVSRAILYFRNALILYYNKTISTIIIRHVVPSLTLGIYVIFKKKSFTYGSSWYFASIKGSLAFG
jgi:hypothetical protein